MFLHVAQVAAIALKVMVPEESIAQGLVGEMPNVEFVVDSQVAKDQYNLLVEDISVQGLDKNQLQEIISASSFIRPMPVEMKEIIKELSIKKTDLVSELKSGAYSFVTVFTNDSAFVKNFKDIKKAVNIKMFCSTSKQTAESLGVPFPGALAFNASDSNVLVLPFHNNIDALIAAVSIPAFSPISQENYKHLQALDQRLFYVIDNTKSFDENKAKFNSAAKQCSSFAKFIFFTPEDVPALIPLLNLKPSDYPVLLSLAADGKGIIRSVKPEGFLTGVQSLITQSAEKLVFSSVIPEDNETRFVKVVNTDTLPKILSPASDRDVLIAFTSPSCQFCQALEPELNAFSKLLTESNIPLFVGNYDIMENEEPAQFKITGVPTIYFLKKGATTPIKVPSDARTAALLLDFISKEGETSKINPEDYKDQLKAATEEPAAEESKEEDEEDTQKEVL